jgi:ParB family transcriptional regulator, chromosome partitioning protein
MTATATQRKPKSTSTKPDPMSRRALAPVFSEAPGEHELQSGNPLPELDNSDKIIIDIDLEDIKPHSSNRDLSSDESIEELALSIEQLGQLEPATVRECPNGQYTFELISGERRYRALQKLGRMTIRAIVIREDASSGLVRLAAANSQRRDLNAIERAELIVQLMKPIAEGGSGLSRASAGQAVGLQSDSGVKNAIRMLKLPESIKKLVRNGDLSERASRRLIAFVDHPAIIKEIERELVHDEARIELAASDNWPYWLEVIIENHTRPMDDEERSASDLVKGCWNRYPMLFEPTDEQLTQLAPFELVDGKETLRVTENCKLWDSLQKPLVEEKYNNSRSPAKMKASAVTATADKKPTAAQLKAEAARKAKEAKERLARFTILWVTYAMRCQLAQQANEESRLATLGFLVQSLAVKHDINTSIDAAYVESKLKMTSISKKWDYLPAKQMPESNEYCWIEDWWANMLWPSPREKFFGGLPDVEKLPAMSDEAVRALATRCKVTMKHFWKDAAVGDTDQRRLLSMWLGRHTTEQLRSLCETMGKKTTLEKRSELVEFLLAEHKPSKLLPMPKELIDG